MAKDILEERVLWFNLIKQVEALKAIVEANLPESGEIGTLSSRLDDVEGEVNSLDGRVTTLEP